MSWICAIGTTKATSGQSRLVRVTNWDNQNQRNQKQQIKFKSSKHKEVE